MSSLAKKLQQQGNPQIEEQTKTYRERVFKGGFTKGEKVLYPLMVIIVIAALYAMLSNYATIYMMNTNIHQIEQTVEQQQSVNEGLQLQVKDLSDPDRILHIAQNELNMELNDYNVQVVQN
ncbi:cell division protein FtsL [Texcoconibacillus texcoconensis]|uniref:Cell division protein FtsL n=1 Tax=Texcoconibacillus texcoconensis TaxID=1095777 RepID=A0A840QLF4_9BACI|nr:cell division protein FtsL [Texcoconibacillus texcoconensis]MBB5172180.1 cell division protein FtsL [Texcoconibacillus texcoconensis]